MNVQCSCIINMYPLLCVPLALCHFSVASEENNLKHFAHAAM